MFDWLKNWRGKANPDDPRTSGGWVTLGTIKKWLRSNEIWEDHSTSDLEAVAQTQLVVYACVKKICLTAQEAPPRIGRDTEKGWEDMPDHPVQRLLKHPNPYMAYPEFQWHVIAHLQLTGVTHVWKWRNSLGQVTELWPVPTSWVTPKLDAAGRIAAYEMFQGDGKQTLPVPARDVVRMIYPDPTNLLTGLGPLQAALKDVQTDSAREDYIVEMMENAKTPGTIFKQPESWSPEQKDEIRAIFASGLGKGKRGRTLFLEGEGASVEQGVPLKDMDWPGLSMLSETRICAAFGVPPILVGLRSGLQTATYSNYEQAIKAFLQGTMVPTWTMLDTGLTRGLLTDELEPDEALEVYHDTEVVAALQEDRDKRAVRVVQLYHAGLISKGRAMELLGEEAPKDGTENTYVMPMNLIEVGAGAPPPEKPPKDNGTSNQ
jgi:HK97 family phage portal protein